MAQIYNDLGLYSIVFILIAFSLDFYLEKFKLKPNCLKTATIISIGWILAAILFALLLWIYLRIYATPNLANQKILEFLTGYLLEKSLSLDNVFVFSLIFKYFKIPNYKKRVILNYGIISAIILRFLMIFFGIWLVKKLHWILYIFGGILVLYGAKILLSNFFNKGKNLDLETNFIIKLSSKYLRISKNTDSGSFWEIKNHKIYATPLLLALISIELTDIVFAVDSIPAILVILDDPFIIFTSNIFAILGLRALYFFLDLSANKFIFLKQGIAIILIFIGLKMIFELKLPIYLTLGFMSSVIILSVLASLLFPKSKKTT